MNTHDLEAILVDRTGISKRAAERTVKDMFASMTKALAAGEKVQIANFGSFSVRDRSARVGTNPQTGEPVNIPARRVPAFSASKALKNAVSK